MTTLTLQLKATGTFKWMTHFIRKVSTENVDMATVGTVGNQTYKLW